MPEWVHADPGEKLVVLQKVGGPPDVDLRRKHPDTDHGLSTESRKAERPETAVQASFSFSRLPLYMLKKTDSRPLGDGDVKVKEAMILGGVMALALSSSSVFADPPHKEHWEARKKQMAFEREQRKRDREWAREERKRYEELEREEQNYEQEMWREGRYTNDEATYAPDDVSTPQPMYIEDQLYQIIKEVRDLADVISQ